MSIVKRVVVAMLVLGTLGVGATAWVLWDEGYRAYVVRSDSMDPTYPAGDLVIDKPTTGRDVRPGDVITFEHGAGADLVTHRITDISRDAIHTKGDGNKAADVWDIHPGQVAGVVGSHLPNGGYLVVFMQQPQAVGGVMLCGLALLLLWGAFFPGSTDRNTTSGGLAVPA